MDEKRSEWSERTAPKKYYAEILKKVAIEKGVYSDINDNDDSLWPEHGEIIKCDLSVLKENRGIFTMHHGSEYLIGAIYQEHTSFSSKTVEVAKLLFPDIDEREREDRSRLLSEIEGFDLATDTLAMPFEVCSVEMLDNSPINLSVDVFCVLFDSSNPNNERVFVLGTDKYDDGFSVLLVSNRKAAIWKEVILKTMVRLNTNRLSKGKHIEKTRCNTNRKKKRLVVRDYLYITGEKYSRNSNDYESSSSGSGYSHTFEVRGHWRLVKGLGLDRYGSRVVEGKTWISAFTKGGEIPLQKARIIREKFTDI